MTTSTPAVSTKKEISPRYDAFISYSHTADARLASALETRIEKLAKPWNVRRAANVFRDETSLAASSHLWQNIASNLQDSAYLILLASTTAAESKWVRKELCYWISGGVCEDPEALTHELILPNRVERVLIVLTEGTITWDDSAGERGNFDWSNTTAVPKVLSQVFVGEPFWIDMRWTREDLTAQFNRSNEEFMKAVKQLSAPIRNLDIETLNEADDREHRRMVNFFYSLIGGLAVAIVIAVTIGLYARKEGRKAKQITANKDLSNADFAIRDHRTVDALHWYMQAFEDAPSGDPLAASARRLLGAWSRNISSPVLHDDSVTAVAFSPDGKTVITGSKDKTARLWKLTGEPLTDPLQHDFPVLAVAFDQSGNTVLTGSGDPSVGTGDARLWDAYTGQLRQAPLPHSGPVWAVVFSPDGQTVLTGSGSPSRDGEAKLWEPRTGKLSTLAHEGPVRTVAFSSDGRSVLTGSDDCTAGLWEPTGEVRMKLKHKGPVKSVAFSSDGKTALTGSDDKTAQLWDAITGDLKGKMEHDGAVCVVKFSRKAETILTASDDGTVRLWGAGMRNRKLQHSGGVLAAEFSHDDQLVITASDDMTARLWDVKTGEPYGEPLRHEGKVSAVAFGRDSQMVVTGSTDNTARFWMTHKDRVKSTPLQRDHGGVRAVAYSRDGRYVLTGNYDKTAVLWDMQAIEPPCELRQHGENVIAVAFSQNGEKVLTGSDDSKAILWNRATGTPQGEFSHNGFGSVLAVAFSPSDREVLTGCDDSIARLWDTETREIRMAFSHQGAVLAVAFSGDGRMILTGSDDNYARLWDAKNGSLLQKLPKLSGSVKAVAFSPDGRMVLTGSEDKTAQLWLVETGEKYRDPFRHKSSVTAVAFSPDGQTVLTGSDDKTARLWDLQTGQPLGEPLRHAQRVMAVAFSPNGQTVLTGSGGAEAGEARIWEVPPPAANARERLQLSVEVRTGSYFDKRDDAPMRFKQAEWIARRLRLKEPCDIRTWAEVSDSEKQLLTMPPK